MDLEMEDCVSHLLLHDPVPYSTSSLGISIKRSVDELNYTGILPQQKGQFFKNQWKWAKLYRQITAGRQTIAASKQASPAAFVVDVVLIQLRKVGINIGKGNILEGWRRNCYYLFTACVLQKCRNSPFTRSADYVVYGGKAGQPILGIVAYFRSPKDNLHGWQELFELWKQISNHLAVPYIHREQDKMRFQVVDVG